MAACWACIAAPSHAQGYRPRASRIGETVVLSPDRRTGETRRADDRRRRATAWLVRLYDDTGTLTVVVPESWTMVETHELDIDSGAQRIAASPDLAAFGSDTGDGVGINLIAQAYEPEPQTLIDQYKSARASARARARSRTTTAP